MLPFQRVVHYAQEYFCSFLVLDIFVNSEQEHECKEEASPSQKVPDVVPEEKTLNVSG